MSDTEHIVHPDGTFTNRKKLSPGIEKRIKNMKMPPKGVSGNPAGKPRGALQMTTILKRQLQEIAKTGDKTLAEEFVAKIIEDGLAGSAPDRKLVFNYVDGMPTQPVSIGNEGGLPFNIIIQVDDGPKSKTKASGSTGPPTDQSASTGS